MRDRLPPLPDEDRIDLLSHLSEAQIVALAEVAGGTRVYLPQKLHAGHPVVRALGEVGAKALVDALGSGTLRIPVARDLRARHFRAAGQSYAQIAMRLGMSEVGVQRMLKRFERRG